VVERTIPGVDMSISIRHSKPLTITGSYNFLRTLPTIAGLTSYGDPIIYSFPNAQVKTEKGISGIQLMIESHCAFHWWPDNKYTHVTISSCKAIKIDKILEFIGEIFATTDITYRETQWT